MTLKTDAFLHLRKKAMTARKERYESRQHEQVTTVAEIAAKLKETPMIKGKSFLNHLFIH